MLPLSSLSLLRGGVQSIAVQLPALASSLSSIGPLVGISPSESDAQPSTSGASTTQASSSRAPLQRQCTSSRGSAWSSPPASARGFSTRAPKQSAPLIQYDSEALALLTPSAIVEKLNRNIIGQDDAKKAVAVAFRNRWRRHRVPTHMKDDITPKNILMMGPTGCGKTEIARRLAKLADAPFVKVEATKFTEVGYHGRDVDSIIKDLVEASIVLVKNKLREQAKAALAAAVEARLIAALASAGHAGVEGPSAVAAWAATSNDPALIPPVLESLRDRLRRGEMDKQKIEVDLPAPKVNLDLNVPGNSGQPMLVNIEKFMQALGGGRKEGKRMTVAAARGALEDVEVDRLFPTELVTKEAVRLAEQDGIVFIDEIDKIVSARNSAWRSGDPSSEGVQRDLLPLIEGSVVQTKHGNVNTEHVLFICSGAFHSCKPSDLMAELQGRLPIRVELKALTKDDFYRILTEPQYNLIKQQQMLLATEGVELLMTDAAVQEIARLAEEINRTTENIGARRLATVLERCVEQISFSAPELASQAKGQGKERHQVVIDKENVQEKVAVVLQKQDLSKWII